VKDFHTSKEVSILAVSLYAVGLGLGPLLLGPLSEFYGRWKVYVYSFVCMFGFTWGVAFAPNAGEYTSSLRYSNIITNVTQLLTL
jgi:MFS family permease